MAHDAKLVYVMIFCVAFGLGLFKTGPLLAGILYQYTFKTGDLLGFRPCLRLAGVSMLLGFIWFTAGMILKGEDHGKKPFKLLKTEEELKREAAEKAEVKHQKLTTLEKKRISAIVLVSAFQIIFWLFWYLAYLPIYYHWAENMNWKVGSFTVPTTWFDSLNALFCVISGPLTALLWQRLERRPQGDMSIFKKLGIGLWFLGIGYIYFAAIDIVRGDSKPTVLLLIIFFVFLTLGEMFFSPLGSAFIGQYSPSRLLAVMSAVWGLGIFAAAKLYGNVYAFAFSGRFAFPKACITIAAVAFASTIILFAIDGKLMSLVKNKDEN